MINNQEKNVLNNQNFEIFFNLLVETNKKFNLTTITSKEEVFEKHFLDSLSASKLIDQNSTVLDVGAGAGFPSIPLAITRSDLTFTLIDSLNKRVNFLNEVKKELNLNNITNFHTRIEDFADKNKGKFDYVVARAVAPLPILLEYCASFLKLGGKIIAYKGSSYEEELNISQNAINVLGLKLETVEKYDLPNCNQERFLLVFSKIKKTPAIYPRKNNKPRTSPL